MRRAATLLGAAHPGPAFAVTLLAWMLGVAVGLGPADVALVVAAVLTGQLSIGWSNDLVDAARDRSHDRTGKPIAQGYVEPGTVWFATACGVLLVVPLSISHGLAAGIAHLALLGVALLTNAGLLRRTRWSYLPWMASFAMWPAFLAYGGWGGDGPETEPTILMTALAALLGIGVHLLTSLPGLVDDNKDGIRHFPLRLALRTGAPRLLVISAVYTAAVTVAILMAGVTDGLVR